MTTPILLLLLLSPGLAQEARPDVPRLELKTCRLPKVQGELRCGRLAAPEDRNTPGGPTISMPVVVLPATATKVAREALFFFAGGPGVSMTENAAGLARYSEESQGLGGIRKQRDIVLLEQRGVGGSKPLGCDRQRDEAPLPLLLSDMLPQSIIRACRETVAVVPEHYSTAAFVADVEDLRAALNYEKIHLAGVSYGTRVALAYMQAHPERVATAVLDGAVPEELLIPASFARDAQGALERVFAACEGDAACRAAFPRFRQDFAELLRRLEKDPPVATYRDPEGRESGITISPHLFAITVRKILYNAQRQALLPWVVSQGLRGRWDEFLEIAVREQRWMFEGLGLYLSIVCREDLAHVDAEAIPKQAEGTFLGDYWYRQLRGACEIWNPEGDAAPRRRTFTSETPVLMVSGGADPVTPPYWAEMLEERLSNLRHVVIADNAHGFFSECLDQVWLQFIESRDPAELDVSCMRAFRRPPFKTGPEKTE